MTNAQGGKFVISSLHTTRPPMSEARRQHIFGKIQSLNDDARAIGEPSLRAGVWLLGLGLVALVGSILFIGELM